MNNKNEKIIKIILSYLTLIDTALSEKLNRITQDDLSYKHTERQASGAASSGASDWIPLEYIRVFP